MSSISTLIQQIKERESRVGILTMQFKKREAEIENMNLEVGSLTAIHTDLIKEEINKLEEISRKEMKHNSLKEMKSVWDALLERNNAEWLEANTLTEQMQEVVFSNRIKYCDDIRHFLDKYDLLLMSFGTAVEKVEEIPIKPKTEDADTEELMQKVVSLEEISNNLTKDIESTENAMKLKRELIMEPNEGQLFTSLRSTLIDLRRKVKDVETKISTMNEDIVNKNLFIEKHKYQTSMQQAYLPTSEDWTLPCSSAQSNSKRSSLSQVTFLEPRHMDTDYDNVVKSIKHPKGSLKRKGFTPKTPSTALRNHIVNNLRCDSEANNRSQNY